MPPRKPTPETEAAPAEEPKKAKRPSQTQAAAREVAVTEGQVPKLELFVPEPISDEDLAKLNVYQRWNRIIGEMGVIPKRGWNDHHKYWFTTDADLNAFVGPLFSKYHLVVIPSAGTPERFDTAGKLIVTRVPLTIDVINADSPDDRFTVQWAGEGGDTGDKGLYKAYTGGLKYFYMKLLQVATGDDPETFARTDAIAEGRGVAALSDSAGDTGQTQVRQVTGRRQPERGGRQDETTMAQIVALGNLSAGMGLGPRGTAEEIDRVLNTQVGELLDQIEGEDAQKAALVAWLKERPGTDTGKVIYAVTQLAEKALEIRTENESAAASDYGSPVELTEEALLADARAEMNSDK